MLSMKSLRVAIVAMGSALLLGSGLALAQDPTAAIDLDGEGKEAPTAVKIATQTIPSEDTTSKTRHVNLGGAVIAITPGIAVITDDRDDYFLRVTLGGGAKFRGTPTGSNVGAVATGGSGSSMVVFRMPSDGFAANAAVGVNVGDVIGLPNANVADYMASMTFHSSVIDARDNVGAISKIGAKDVTFLKAVSGVASSITSATLTADVETGFLWFVNPTASARASMPNVSRAKLGTVQAQPDTAGSVLNAADGTAVEAEDVIHSTAGVTIKVEGDFSVGAFALEAFTDTHPAGAVDGAITKNDSATCPATLQGTKTAPGKGNLVPSKADPTMATLSDLGPGIYQLCVEVDTAGAQSNTMPIPAGEYTATVSARATNGANDPYVEENSAKVGEIKRNGATANVSYLTTSEKHNQRLIIVNRGSRPITMTGITFQTEDGTEADLSDAAKAAAAIPGAGTIGPGDSVTYRVRDMLSITGNSRRTGASMSFNGSAANVSVATTQVNLEDSSTDTVMWPVK